MKGASHLRVHTGDSSSLTPPTIESPTCPSHLDREAKNEWRRVVAILTERGTLDLADRAALATYCQLWGWSVALEKQIADEGKTIGVVKKVPYEHPITGKAMERTEITGKYIVNPAVMVLKDVRTQLLAYSKEFGLTQRSRKASGVESVKKANKVETRKRS